MNRKTFTVKITGSGTASHLASRLYEIGARAHNITNFGGEDIAIIQPPDDGILTVEIVEE